MTKTKTTTRNDGASINFDELPDARITIDLKRVEGGWVAYGPNDSEGIVGRGDTAPRAAEDYYSRMTEYLESNGT